MPKDWAGDIDRIVKGKFIDDIDRSIVSASQSLGKLDARRHFNLVGQSFDHFSKRPDLIFSIPARN